MLATLNFGKLWILKLIKMDIADFLNIKCVTV